MGKKIILIAAAIFLVWQSVHLLDALEKLTHPEGLTSFFMAFLFNLYLTGIAAFSGFALPTQKLMPNHYYQISRPKQLKEIYRLLKVSLFRDFLLATFWRGKRQRKEYFDGTRSGIENLETQSMKAEFGHLIPALLITVVVIYQLLLGFFQMAFLTTLINIPMNFYPILLQRHHRMRIEILKRRHRNS